MAHRSGSWRMPAHWRALRRGTCLHVGSGVRALWWTGRRSCPRVSQGYTALGDGWGRPRTWGVLLCRLDDLVAERQMGRMSDVNN